GDEFFKRLLEPCRLFAELRLTRNLTAQTLGARARIPQTHETALDIGLFFSCGLEHLKICNLVVIEFAFLFSLLFQFDEAGAKRRKLGVFDVCIAGLRKLAVECRQALSYFVDGLRDRRRVSKSAQFRSQLLELLLIDDEIRSEFFTPSYERIKRRLCAHCCAGKLQLR